MSEEVLYSFKVNRHNSLVIHKWDGHKEPVDQVTVTQRGKGKCDCFGSMRSSDCKHRKMAAKLNALNMPLMGCFYDYDHDILYTPEDGEGIPLQGVVDIWGTAIEQGKAY